MSEILQAGQHPDADQLNAFVEHTLPAHEQQQTLAHLAVCPACRQIVALSLPPDGEIAARRPEAVWHRWFPRLHPAWVGIPALAAVVLLILFIRNGGMTARQRSAPAQMADARPPVAPPSSVSTPADTARNTVPVTQLSNEKRAVAARNQPSRHIPPAQELVPGGASGAMGGVMGGIAGGVASQPAQPSTNQPLRPSSSIAAPSASVGGPMRALAVDRLQSVFPTPSPLPSHLAILSLASQASQRLAIDTENHLFFSDDGGRHWKTVPSKWQGRAVRIALTSAVSVGSAAPAALTISSHLAAVSTLSGTVTGTIKDPTGAVIPGATVTATNSSGALSGSVTTDSHGQYRIEDLTPGSYRIEAQATGFQKQSFTAAVAPLQQAVADVSLPVGSAAQTVTVQASPVPLDTSPTSESPTTKLPANLTPSRFELTTDKGERWVSSDGQTWSRE
jgi:Carboxypeptidase regulatory-like domain/Putative zinc-finger